MTRHTRQILAQTIKTHLPGPADYCARFVETALRGSTMEPTHVMVAKVSSGDPLERTTITTAGMSKSTKLQLQQQTIH